MELKFKFERETKNTFRFQEVVEEGEEAVVGTLYVRKAAFKSKVEFLTVTIKEATE